MGRLERFSVIAGILLALGAIAVMSWPIAILVLGLTLIAGAIR